MVPRESGVKCLGSAKVLAAQNSRGAAKTVPLRNHSVQLHAADVKGFRNRHAKADGGRRKGALCNLWRFLQWRAVCLPETAARNTIFHGSPAEHSPPG
jgi:hypothetical protein